MWECMTGFASDPRMIPFESAINQVREDSGIRVSTWKAWL